MPENFEKFNPISSERFGDESKNKSQAYPEARSAKVEHTKEIQSELLRKWAERQNPPLIEGKDFMLPKIEDEENPENISPHELTNVYFGFKQEYFGAVKNFFENEYFDLMKTEGMHNEWTLGTKLNYSWAGRLCIEEAGGGAIDTAPLQSIDPPLRETHHQEFKELFRQEAGFDLPSPEKLDEILEKMSDNLEWYKSVQAELNKRIVAEEEKKRDGGKSESWKYNKYALNMAYIVKILGDAKKDRKMQELPGVITGKLDEKIRHYNDLTYNIDDHFNLDEVNRVLDGHFPPPKERGARLDRIYEDYFNFKREGMEDICRKFSEKLYGR